MKKVISIIFLFFIMFLLVGCDNGNPPNDIIPPSPSEVTIDNDFKSNSKILVVYFSKTNTTETVAKQIQELTKADIFEVERKEPYPEEYTPTTQVARKEKDDNARPELLKYISKEVMANYDTIFLGFPIWWGTAPMPILSFLNFYDFTGKTIYTFCTAASSSITGSTNDINTNAKGAKVVEGKKFSRSDVNGITSWIESLNLSTTPTPTSTITYEHIDGGYVVTGDTGNNEEIVIPDEYENEPVIAIGESAFTYVKHPSIIKKVVISDSIKSIQSNAFYNRSDIVNIQINKTSKLEYIGNNAFSWASSLESIYLPKTLIMLGDEGSYSYPYSVFNGCGSLDTIEVDTDNEAYSSEGNALIEKKTGKLIRATNNTVISENVKIIGERSFSDLNKMTTIIIPTTVETIENYIISWSSTSIKTIKYLGTEEEWNLISKASSWDNDNSEYTLEFNSGERKMNILIVYYSATNNTEKVAKYIEEILNCTLFELTPKNPYTSDDLNWTNSSSRVNVEHNDENLRDVELVTTTVDNWDDYDIVFIGYPIWWYIAAWPVNNFVKSNDFTGKTVIPFCTSSSSGIGDSGKLLEEMTNTGTWLEGRRFASYAQKSDVQSWLDTLSILKEE